MKEDGDKEKELEKVYIFSRTGKNMKEIL